MVGKAVEAVIGRADGIPQGERWRAPQPAKWLAPLTIALKFSER
jgi:hypothetical protein